MLSDDLLVNGEVMTQKQFSGFEAALAAVELARAIICGPNVPPSRWPTTCSTVLAAGTPSTCPTMCWRVSRKERAHELVERFYLYTLDELAATNGVDTETCDYHMWCIADLR